MDTKKKKELLQQWKNRRPEMGVISFRCKKTGESFLGISKDTKADFNSNRFKLSGGGASEQKTDRALESVW